MRCGDGCIALGDRRGHRRVGRTLGLFDREIARTRRFGDATVGVRLGRRDCGGGLGAGCERFTTSGGCFLLRTRGLGAR